MRNIGILSLLLLLVLGSCRKVELPQDDELKGGIESADVKLAALQEQMDAISESVQDLLKADESLSGYIALLEKVYAELLQAADDARKNLAGIEGGSTGGGDKLVTEQIEALRKELEAEIASLQIMIESLKEKDSQLEELIEALQERVREELSETDWLEETYATLEMQIEAATLLSELRVQAEAFAGKIDSMRTSLENDLSKGIEEAVSELDAGLADVLKGVTDMYSTALDEASESVREAYLTYLDGALKKAEEDIKEWYGQNISLYYDIVSLEALLASRKQEAKDALDLQSESLKADVEDMSELLQGQIDAADQELADLRAAIGSVPVPDNAQLHLETVAEQAGQISINAAAIQANASAIASNASAIESNAERIAANKALIEKNAENVQAVQIAYDELKRSGEALSSSILEYSAQLISQAEVISEQASLVARQSEAIQKNAAAIQENKAAIEAFQESLAGLEEEITQEYMRLIAEKLGYSPDGVLEDIEKRFDEAAAGVEAALKAIDARIKAIEDSIPSLLEILAALERQMSDLEGLLEQIQSVVLMSEYSDNTVLAPYSGNSSIRKMDIELTYMIRPASAAAELVGRWREVMCAKAYYLPVDSGFEFITLPIKGVDLQGDMMTVSVDASNLADDFYNGDESADLALQISDGNSEILSDFARLVPVARSSLNFGTGSTVPVLKGAKVSIPFSYSVTSDSYTMTVKAKGNAAQASVNYFDMSRTGYVHVDVPESYSVEGQGVELTLTCGDEQIVRELTFVEGGRFTVSASGTVDYIGGEVTLSVVENSFGSYSYELTSGGGWASAVSASGIVYSFAENTSSSSRQAVVSFTINNGSLRYTKAVPMVQYGYGTPLQRYYYPDGTSVMLNTASAGYTPLNIVILGDGYKKKDLTPGGKFERSARSAVDSFFGVEPFKSFKNRFNVYMATYASADEGVDIQSQNLYKDTYFETWWNGNSTAMWVTDSGRDKVINVVKNTLGLSSDAQYYRTIVLVLSNTDAVAGSCGYPYRDRYYSSSVVGEDYASFAIAVIPANSTATNGLVRHELGGHGFGRLGDEYETMTYGSDLAQWHAKGFYRNITTDRNSWNWDGFIGRSGYEDVGYVWRNNNYWCPSAYGIMYNNNGEFNAPSRQIIYERIIRQTQGYNAYSFEGFLRYDEKLLSL